MKKEKNWAVVFGSLLTAVALVAVVTVAIWGAISAVRLAPRLFGSIEKTIVPDAIGLSPLEVQSGVPFTLSWEDAKKTGGFYTILFACAEGFEVNEVRDKEQTPIPCGTPLEMPESVTSLRVLPRVTNNTEKVVAPITISYLSRDGKKIAEGITSLTVLASATTTDVTKQPKTPRNEAPIVSPQPQTSGTPDLVIRLIGIGVIDPITRAFIPKKMFGSYEIVSLKFDVANRGDGRTGNWAFSTSLPTRTHTHYQPPVQQPLNPGDHIEFNLDFGSPTSGTIQINIDPANAIAESNEYNNQLSEYISVVY